MHLVAAVRPACLRQIWNALLDQPSCGEHLGPWHRVNISEVAIHVEKQVRIIFVS